MSAQAPGPDNVMKDEVWQSTPVVIKTGGDLDPEGKQVDPSPHVECTIHVKDDKELKSRLVGAEWQSARTGPTASIVSVEIVDGGNKLQPILADGNELVVVQISYGEEILIFQEAQVPDSELTRITVSSSLPFKVTESLDAEDWSKSTADVPAKPPFVLFTQGQTSTPTQCKSMDVEITVMMDWD